MIDPVIDLSPLLHLLVELIALILRDLRLMIEQVPAKRKVIPVRTAGDGDAALGLSDELLHVNDDVGRPLDQGLVMGDIEDRQLAPGDEVLEPAQRRNIQIVRRLVEQQDVRLFHQQAGQLHLDPLAAGQGGKKLLRQEKVQRQAELCHNVHVQIVVRISKVGQQGLGLRVLWHHLGQIGNLSLLHDFPGAGAIALDKLRVHDVFQKRGFSVSLLPDQNGLVIGLQGKGKVLREAPSVFLQTDRNMIQFQHNVPPYTKRIPFSIANHRASKMESFPAYKGAPKNTKRRSK